MSTSFARPVLVPSPVDEPEREPDVVEPRQLRAVGPGRDPAALSGAEASQLALVRLAVARNPVLAASDPWAAAGREVLRGHLSRMLARLPGTIAGDDPEEVHAMRVASRRLRAGWRIFGDAFERPVVRDHVREVRALGAGLGAVRDLDVQIGILVASGDRRSKRERAALSPMIEAWSAERAARHAALVERLDSAWFVRFIADHEAFVMTPDAGQRPIGPHAPSTVRMRAPAVAWEAYQAVWAFDAALPGADVGTLHELRIATKWLRYTLESLREVMEPEATELIRRVVALQDQLGDIHDNQATAERARATEAEGLQMRPGQRAAIERFAAAKDLRVERLRRRLGPTWRGVADADYRRRLGTSLARL